MEDALRDEVNRLHAQVCGAVADPNRILMIYALNGRELNVGEIAQSLGIPQPTASRHLKVLRDSGIARARREGQSIYYSLADQRFVQALDLMRAAMTDTLQNQANLAHAASEGHIS